MRTIQFEDEYADAINKGQQTAVLIGGCFLITPGEWELSPHYNSCDHIPIEVVETTHETLAHVKEEDLAAASTTREQLKQRCPWISERSVITLVRFELKKK